MQQPTQGIEPQTEHCLTHSRASQEHDAKRDEVENDEDEHAARDNEDLPQLLTTRVSRVRFPCGGIGAPRATQAQTWSESEKQIAPGERLVGQCTKRDMSSGAD